MGLSGKTALMVDWAKLPMVSSEREVQPEKALPPIVSKLAGRRKDCKEEQPLKACRPMARKLGGGVTDVSIAQSMNICSGISVILMKYWNSSKDL